MITRRAEENLYNIALRDRMARRLEVADDKAWVNDLSTEVGDTNDRSEEYATLDVPPTPQPAQSGHAPSRPSIYTWTIDNEPFISSIELPNDMVRRNKTKLIDNYLDDMARRWISHWRKLLTTNVNSMKTVTIPTDGAAFFSAAHEEGSNTAQKNLVTSSEIAKLSVVNKDNPTEKELQDAVIAVVSHMYGFLDRDSEPFNEDAMSFLVMVPTGYMPQSIALATQSVITSANGQETNKIMSTRDGDRGINIDFTVNPRLSWTDQFVVFRRDTSNRTLVRQWERLERSRADGVQIDVLGLGTEYEIEHSRVKVKAKASRNTGITTNWFSACHATLATT